MCNTLDTLTVVLNMRVSGLVFAMCVLLFLFFKQKTAYEMRISDWSSDVCSSDLVRVRKCASLPGEAMTPPNILMVEDDPPIRTLTARALQEHGYIVRTAGTARSEEHTSELQSLMRISYAVFCLKKKKYQNQQKTSNTQLTKEQNNTDIHHIY